MSDKGKKRSIYIVTAGSYSDYGIQGAFSTSGKAELFIERAKNLRDDDGDNLVYWASDAYVEEWPIDELLRNKRQRIWTCGMLLDDGSIVEPKIERSSINWCPPFRAEITQLGDKVPAYGNRRIVRTRSTVSQAHAEKVAAEARQKWLRESALSKHPEVTQ